MKSRWIKTALTLLCGYSSMVFAADALQVMPTRVVLDTEKAAELTLVNRGDTKGKYRISLRNIRVDDSGKFQIAESPEGDELFADKLIRYSPRTVSIEAGEYQKVRVMLRKPKSLSEGEYRTHMVFKSLPEQTRNTLAEQSGDKVGVSVQTVIEVSIPVIVRHGAELNANVSIDNVSLNENNVLFDLHRSGTRSVYGDVEVFINNNGMAGERVGYVRGISVYYPNKKRSVKIPLAYQKEGSLDLSNLIIRYTEDETYGGNASATHVDK